MKAILFLLACILMLSFAKVEMKTGIRTPPEKYAGKVKTLTVEDYLAWITPRNQPEKDTLVWRSTVIMNFDKQGLEHDEGYYDPKGKLLNTNTPKYDAHGNNSEIMSVDKHGQVFTKIYNRYDSLGNKVEEIHYNEKDSVSSRFTYKYDTSGNCIEWKRFNNKKANTSRHSLSYDKKNNSITEQSFIMGGDKPFEKYIYKYNEKGQEIEKKFYRSDTLVGRDVNSYDEHGNLFQTMHYAPNGKLQDELSTIRKYEYDKTGNWTKLEIRSSAGKIRFRTLRKFEYY